MITQHSPSRVVLSESRAPLCRFPTARTPPSSPQLRRSGIFILSRVHVERRWLAGIPPKLQIEILQMLVISVAKTRVRDYAMPNSRKGQEGWERDRKRDRKPEWKSERKGLIHMKMYRTCACVCRGQGEERQRETPKRQQDRTTI